MRRYLVLASLIIFATAPLTAHAQQSAQPQPANATRPYLNPDTPPPAHGFLAPPTPRADRGAPLVDVSQQQLASGSNRWLIEGQKNQIAFMPGFNFGVRAGTTDWEFTTPSQNDITIKSGNETKSFPLTAAKSIRIEPYDTGFKTGIKITLADFPISNSPTLYLTLALEGNEEDLVADVVATEPDQTSIRELNWPAPLDPSSFDASILSHVRGVLLPKNWPLEYNPIREQFPDGSYKYPNENSPLQSHVIEDWSMSWWGFQQGNNAMMCIVETPDDAAQNFSHPAGGPTILGPRWRASLGKLRYERTCRFVFLPDSNYVQMAKRYRQYAKDTGLFVSLQEKITRNPEVADLIGTPKINLRSLQHFHPTSLKYDNNDPSKNDKLTTFAQREDQLKNYKAQGLDKLLVIITGWPHLGYDRQHPDELPVAPEAGGAAGLKHLQDTIHDLGYLFALHDQYRDYYTDAPSWDPQFAVHEEDATTRSDAFPGSRFGQYKLGNIPFMNNWDGGEMSYLNNRFMPGEIKKNYEWLNAHGIKPDGVSIDVFGYVPVDEDFNPEHPTSRTDALNAHRLTFTWARQHIGFLFTEAGCDWTIPYVDYVSNLATPITPNKGIPIPLYNLVYHDAVICPYNPDDLHGLLNAGCPQITPPRPADGTLPQFATTTFKPEYLAAARRMAALHKRLALQEMINHEFLTPDHKQERTTFADGTTVTVDWKTKTATINPDVP